MLLRLVLPALALLAIVSSAEAAKDLSVAKLKKNYDKINEYLEKKLFHTTNPVQSMIVIEVQLKINLMKRRWFRASDSYLETLRMFTRLEMDSPYTFQCDTKEQKKLLEKLDSVWMEDHSRAINLNYRLTKIDQLLTHYAFKAARQCYFNGRWPTLYYAYKQLAYDYINDYLLAQQPNSEDIEANLQQVQEHLDELEDKDGALAVALKQILELRTTLKPENCNEVGYFTLLKNDLATSGRARVVYGLEQPLKMRRIDKIVNHFMEAHRELCLPNRETTNLSLMGLSVSTYRCVLALVNYYYYLGQDVMKDVLHYLDHKEVDENFTTPLMLDYAKRSEKHKLPEVGLIEATELRRFVKIMNQEDQPKRWSSREQEMEERRKYPGSMVLPKGAVNDLFDKYLILPCSLYLDSMGALTEADLYKRAGFEDLVEEDNAENLSYQMILSGYRLCKYVVQNKLHVYYGFGAI